MSLKLRFVCVSFIFLFVLLLDASAYEYYGDIEIHVRDDGRISIDGTTNYPSLEIENSAEYTSKQGKYWVLNLTFDQEFKNLIYTLRLPKRSFINYIKSPRLARIEARDDGLYVIGTAENQKFNLILQYQIPLTNPNYRYLYYVVGFILISSFAFIFFNLFTKTKLQHHKIRGLTERQKTIWKLVKKNNEITQAELEKITKLPKSSLSRNIDSLIRKGFLKKESKGMSNIIYLNDRNIKKH